VDVPERAASSALQPWQFFVLAALICATVLTWIVRGQGVTTVILVTLLMAGVAIVAVATLRMVRPLVSPSEDRTPVVGEWTRAALEREKQLTLRTIKELEFDRSMGKVSEDDYREMAGRLRARAARLIQQLDAGAGYRSKIERDLAKRLGSAATDAPPATAPAAVAAGRACAECSTVNDTDAKFCKSCGTRL
jgi:hypothetical protein